MTSGTPSATTSGGSGILGGVGNVVSGATGAVSGVLSGVGNDLRNPLRTLASVWGPVHSIAAGVIVAGSTLGVLNSKSSGFLNKGLQASDIVMAGITGILAGVAPLTAVAQVVRQGEQLVTPVADPRDNSGQPLTT